MREGPDIARVAALIGDPARANILAALVAGRALTISELAAEAGVALPTASGHVAQLTAGGLVRPRRAGRHKYVELASDETARMLEAIMGFAAGHGQLRQRPGPRDPALRHARVCYDHLAGEMGVRLYDSLSARGFLVHTADGLGLSAAGRAFVQGLGVPEAALAPGRRPLCRDCLDWSERRNHLAGRLGRAFLATVEAKGWARRSPGSRVITFTPPGKRAFLAAFPLPPARENPAPGTADLLDGDRESL